MIQDAVILLLQLGMLCLELLCALIELLQILLTEMKFLNFTTVSFIFAKFFLFH